MKILLDYDNTMAETEVVAMSNACVEAHEVLSLHGVTFKYDTDEFIEQYTGSTFRSMLEDLTNKHNFTLSTEEVKTLVAKEMESAIVALGKEGALKPTRGIMDCLAELSQRNNEMAVVSSTAMKRLLVCLKATDQIKYFETDKIFSAQCSLPEPMPKPEPNVYTHAMKTVGGYISEYIAVEDSVSGVKSASRAGIRFIIGFVGAENESKHPKTAQKLFNAGAQIVIDDMFKVVEINDRLMRGETSPVLQEYGEKAWQKKSRVLAGI